MKYLALILLVVGIFGCTKVCELAQSTAASFAAPLAAKWACTNPSAVEADIRKVVADSIVCKDNQPKRGAIGSMICPVLTDFLRGQLANQVPASWGCNPALVGKDAAGALSGICSSVFPF